MFCFDLKAKRSDLILVAELAMNKKRIKRLEEAREFVAKALVYSRNNGKRWKNEELRFYGHSLGGFVAESLIYEYPGSRSATMATGAPLMRRGSKRPRAYRVPSPLPANFKLPIRFMIRGDPVSKGYKNLGPGINMMEGARKSLSLWESLNGFKQHSLLNYLTFMKEENNPVALRRSSDRKLSKAERDMVKRLRLEVGQTRRTDLEEHQMLKDALVQQNETPELIVARKFLEEKEKALRLKIKMEALEAQKVKEPRKRV
jgi:hypothetical protein